MPAPGLLDRLIASHHLGHPGRAADYFDQSLLEDPTRNNEDGVTPKPVG